MGIRGCKVSYKPYNSAVREDSITRISVEKPVFRTMNELHRFIDKMQYVLDEFGYVKVGEYYEWLWATTEDHDWEFGWTSLEDMSFYKTKLGYVLSMPNAYRLVKKEEPKPTKITVTIEETIVQEFEVEVKNPENPYDEIRKMYRDGKLVLESTEVIHACARIDEDDDWMDLI